MEAKPAEKLSKLDETEQSNRQEETNISSSHQIEESVEKIKEAMAERGIKLTPDDIKGLRAYLRTESQWEGVYRRLANS